MFETEGSSLFLRLIYLDYGSDSNNLDSELVVHFMSFPVLHLDEFHLGQWLSVEIYLYHGNKKPSPLTKTSQKVITFTHDFCLTSMSSAENIFNSQPLVIPITVF